MERLVKFFYDRRPFYLPFGDFVQIFFHFSGKVYIHYLGKMRDQNVVDHVSGFSGDKSSLLVFGRVIAGLDGGDSRGVSGRPADAVFFHRFYQAGFVVSRGRFGEMLFRFQFL